SDEEAALYEGVTSYVREELHRADRLDGQRRGPIAFALTILQRRLASSPSAIFHSLRRRPLRLQPRLEAIRPQARGRSLRLGGAIYVPRVHDLPENLDEADEELSAGDWEQYTEEVSSQATTAETITELETEIASLEQLEEQARRVVASGNDSKWAQLSQLLHDHPEMRDRAGNPRKLILFTDHRH